MAAGLFSFSASAQDAGRWSVRMAESVMARHPGGITNWDYVTGTYLEGIEEAWRLTGDSTYYRYIRNSIDPIVSENGSIVGYKVSDYNIDDIKEGTMLLFLYKTTGLEIYKNAAGNVRQQFYNHPRTNEGGFWHKQVYPWQMWLDGLYMGSPFYAEYGMLFHEPEDLDDVVHQITQMEKHARDSVTGLLYHGWDESRTQFWADPVTGQSPSFWGRAMGWYAMAIVDVLDCLPAGYEGRDTIVGILQRMAEAIADCQDPVKKVWWQVLDRGGDANNYTESSASVMFVYALAKGVRLGYLDEFFRQVAIDGFNGILDEFVEENTDGTIDLTKTCITAGLGGSRDGSYEYYTQVAGYRTNDGKGEGPFMLAAAEIEMIDSLYPVAFLMIDSATAEGVHMQWGVVQPDADSVLIERSNGTDIIILGTVSADIHFFTDTTSLTPGELYRYAIRIFNDTDTSRASHPALHVGLNPGNLPMKAGDPEPQNETAGVPIEPGLSWSAGTGATQHRVHFGNTNPPPLVSEQEESTYLPGTLEYDTEYNWRIDEENGNGITEGDLWTFHTRLPNTLVGHWAFDEISGTTVTDSSDYGNDGQIINGTEENHAEGIRGGALHLTGGEYVRIPHDEVLNFGTGDFTVAFYALIDPALIQTGEEYRLLIKGSHVANSGEGRSGKRYEVFLHGTSDEIRFTIDDDVTKSRAIIPASEHITGRWTHFAVVRKNSSRELRFYVNGTPEAVESDNTGDINQEEDLLIGNCVDFENYLTGKLDEVRIYNYALSNSEIQKLLIPASATWPGIVDSQESRLTAFSLPGGDRMYVSVRMPGESRVTISLRDLLGRTLFEAPVSLDGNGKARYIIPLTGLNPGACLLTSQGSRICETIRLFIN
ncbi:MAG: glycoside hydrolase family 88 protein [Bacteroidales bacterium]|nr:glycoside hydrolase family 88 protein [Bacteroidales bacterium]